MAVPSRVPLPPLARTTHPHMAHPQLNTRQWRDIRAHHKALGHPCGICGNPINPAIPAPHPLSFAVDHIIPKAPPHNGSNSIENTMAVHAGCNSAKRDRPLTPELRQACRELYERLTAEPVRHLDTAIDWYSPHWGCVT